MIFFLLPNVYNMSVDGTSPECKHNRLLLSFVIFYVDLQWNIVSFRETTRVCEKLEKEQCTGSLLHRCSTVFLCVPLENVLCKHGSSSQSHYQRRHWIGRGWNRNKTTDEYIWIDQQQQQQQQQLSTKLAPGVKGIMSSRPSVRSKAKSQNDQKPIQFSTPKRIHINSKIQSLVQMKWSFKRSTSTLCILFLNLSNASLWDKIWFSCS